MIAIIVVSNVFIVLHKGFCYSFGFKEESVVSNTLRHLNVSSDMYSLIHI